MSNLPIALWTHALAALLFAVLALAQMRRPGAGLPRATFIAALGLTSLWALAVAGIGGGDVATRIAEGSRNLAWLAFMFALARRRPPGGGRAARGQTMLYGVVALVLLTGIVLGVAQETQGGAAAARLGATRLAFRMIAAAGALLLVHRLWLDGDARAPSGVRVVGVALGTLWATDLIVYTAAYALDAWPAALIAARGAALAALVPAFWLAVHRDGDWTLRISRTVAFQSLGALAIGLYIVVTGFAAGFLGELGGSHARLIQTAFVFGSAAALLTVASTPWLRASAKVVVAKHLFRHRYDYRAEWLRFTGTIGLPDEAGAAPIGERVVKAMADLVDAPSGQLLIADGAGLSAGAAWRSEGAVAGEDMAALARHLAATHRTLELDAVRIGTAPEDDIAAVPAGIAAREDAWAIVPLVHLGQLSGAVLLDRPPVARSLDWEDFDLFGVAGRQAASYLAEDRAGTALAEARRFDEFNRRFAFILHDLKNLVSQQTLVARNAERHADNPAFRVDMVATLRDSAERMTALLAKLTQAPAPRSMADVVALLPLARRMAAGRRAQHSVIVTGDDALVRADEGALETLLGHLIQNAIEASAPGCAIELIVAPGGITVADRGGGMTPAFVRDELFRPFASSKPAGFGLGAFEARQLAEAMGGSVSVSTREGEGSRFTVSLPPATSQDMEQAA